MKKKSKLIKCQVSPTKGILPKDCSKCVEALMGCWEGDYCFRDEEALSGSKKTGTPNGD